MDLAGALKHVFSNYAKFNGRARRSEFWYFELFNFLVEMGLVICAAFLGPAAAAFMSFYSLGVMIPRLAVSCRRLHDTGRSGVWLLISLVPLVGAILLIIWFSEDSHPGSNQYGPNPKGMGSAHPAPQPQPRGYTALPIQSYLSVQCLSGPLQGQIYRVPAEGLIFGRGPECAVRMTSDTPGVSGRHCMICFQQGRPVLIDLGSHYGTYLADGKKLPPNYPEPVAAGTRFCLGSKNILFQITAM